MCYLWRSCSDELAAHRGVVSSTRYLEIAEELGRELDGCTPGTRVASEHEITTRFGVGRATARAAVQELERRLVVRRVQGSGTYVNRRIDYVISHRRPPSWTATVTAAGAKPRALVKDVDQIPLPDDRAARLARPAGSLAHRVIREFYIDDLLASWVHEWIPVDLVPDLDLALHAVDSIDLVLRQMGRVSPVRAWCRVSLDVPPSEVLRGLRMEASQPAWLVESASRDASSGQLLMCSDSWTRADAVRVVVELQDDPGLDDPGLDDPELRDDTAPRAPVVEEER
ncbi:DNA-binding GntR family transcriptional regulator [Tamaricihabitans halophyticus]|uniref:DNA-binding GntR family transcriptional regulator n=1 Tax=Tamaricihabitans halophyticus TaxID=1262583 RepID=A0A4R2QWG9_9PSEU|nr:DNA-binding GntR family transcriptional regulator [Tamaricihabitans halophyticus]